MKNILSFLFCALFLGLFTSGYCQNETQKNIYGLEIRNASGEKINYSESELQQLNANFNEADFKLKSTKVAPSSDSKIPMKTKIDKLYSIMGTSIGRNSMHSIDIDHDGTLELICTASNQTFGDGNFWYIMRYNTAKQTWNQIWISTQETNRISTLEVIDFNNDGNYKILLGFENGTLKIYDGATRELLKTVSPLTEKINSIVYADADNDSKKDIIISGPSNTYILDPETFVQKFQINKGANYVRVGKLDDSNLNEIVLSSGYVYKLDRTTLTTLWNFNTSGEGYVELSDIDSDTKQEIVFAQSWQHIYVYDVDTKTTKYGIDTDLDIQSLLLTDVDKDGIDDIIYGDGQWGSVHCYNAVNKAQLWKVSNPEHGVAAINYADLNNDGNKELIWSAGWTSTGSDYLYIYNVDEAKLLWRSDDIVGPFYAVASGDVDGDGKEEIVATSYKSESGYNGGILFIIDSETNQLKWKSSSALMNLGWTGLFNVVIDDVDKDGTNEIIVAAGQTYTGEILIINGKDYTIKSSHVFSNENMSELYALAVDDIDQDNQKELIVASNSYIYVINPTDWSVKWNVNGSSSYEKPTVKIADINGDGKKEIIVCQQGIKVINSADHSYWALTDKNYVNTDIVDFNNDGIADIVASTSDGHIVVIDGNSRTLLSDMAPESSKITSVRVLKTGNSLFYVYSCDGKINFYQNGANCGLSEYLGDNTGEIESLKLIKTKSGTTELLIGTSTSVLRMYWNILLVSANKLTVAAPENSTVKFDISTAKNWSISNSSSWLKLSSASGSGNTIVTLTAQANVSVEKRTAFLTISDVGSNSQLVTVVQNGADPILTISTPSLTIEETEGSTSSFNITSNMNWTAISTGNWLTVNQPGGTGNATLIVNANANPTIQTRTDTIKIAGSGVATQKIIITQKAGTASLTVSSNSITLAAGAGSAQPLTIYSNIDWTAGSNQSWLSLNPSVGSGNLTITLTPEANPTTETRSTTVTVSGVGVATQTITVTQNGQTPNLLVSSNAISIGASNGSKQTINIASNIDWTVTCDQSWLTLSSASGSKSGEITLTALLNSTIVTRTAKVEISGKGVTSQIVEVAQDAGTPLLSVSVSQLTLSSPLNTATFTIVSNTSWEVLSNQTWLKASMLNGSGNATITLTAESNADTKFRIASVVVSGDKVQPQAISVLQDATVGVDDIDENEISVFPNPATTELTVTNAGERATILIYDSKGNLIISKNAVYTPHKLDVSHLLNGIYTIKVINKTNTKTSKFIKQ